MTTETFPFTTGEQQQVGPPEPPEQGRTVNKKALAAGGGVLALALAGGAFLLLSGGGGEPASQGLVPAGKPPATHAPQPPGQRNAHKPHKKLPIYQGAPAGRDPFKPLVTAPPPAPAATTAPAPVPTSTGVPIVGPGTGGTLPGGTGGGGPTPAPTTPAPSTVLVFRSITFSPKGNVPTVDITYNGTAYHLKAGGTVSGTLKVVAIEPDDSIAVFQVGDQTFDLHAGQAWIG